MSICSAMFAPRKSRVSAPAWPSTVSLPSPGFQTKRSSPAPRRATSSPLPPATRSLPSPPMRRSAPWLPVMVSLPRPPSIVSFATAAGRAAALIVSSPSNPLTMSASFAPSAFVMLTSAGSPVTETEVPAPSTWIASPALVPFTAIESAAPSPPPSEAPRSISTRVTSVPDSRVGAAKRAEGDRLDVVHIHGDGGHVPGEPRVSAVRRDVNVLGDVRAVEQQRVGSILALDSVAAVARIPHEGVVAGAEKRRVVAASAGDEVVAVAAKKQVVAVAAGDGVVAGTAVDGDLDERREAVAGGEPVVAAVHVEDEVLGGADVEGERRRVDAVEAHASAVRREREALAAVAALDLGGIDVGAALEQIGVVAGVPDHAVVPGLAEDLVVARAAGQDVVAVAAEQVGGWQRAIGLVERQRVVAALAEDLDQAGVGDGRGAARDRDGAAVDQNGSGRVAARRHRVV